MKKSLLTFCSIVLAVFLAAPAPAQTRTAAAVKIGFVDTRVFLDAKNGIKKYVDAIDAVNNEFKGAAAELDGIALKLQNLRKELENFREQAGKGAQLNQATVNAKLEEFDKLSREYQFKKDDNEAKYNRRQMALVIPVQSEITAALREYTKKNGYTMLLDVSKFRSGMVLAIDEKADVTKDFIAFYNARLAKPVAK